MKRSKNSGLKMKADKSSDDVWGIKKISVCGQCYRENKAMRQWNGGGRKDLGLECSGNKEDRQDTEELV